MSSRSSRVRTKIVALLVSLAALWGFAAFVTIREGLDLLAVSTLDKGIAEPAETLLPAIQEERRLTVIYLGGHSPSQQTQLLAQRAKTNSAITTFRELASGGDVKFASSDALQARLADTFSDFDDLLATDRADVDAGRLSRATAAGVFTDIIDSVFRVYDSMATLDDPGIAKDARELISIARARELISQEDALVAGAITAGGLTDAERQRFIELVGSQRFLRAETSAALPPADQQRYDEVVKSETFIHFSSLESAVEQSTLDGRPPTTADDWSQATAPVLEQLKQLYVVGGDDVVARATPVATGVIIRLALAGGLGLLAVIASIVISITTARNLVRQLERLRSAALELASYRLPRVVARLQHGEKVDIDAEAPPLDFGRDEIGQVSQAFNAVQETAIRVAVEQAELRRSVRDVFLSLARRSQALLHRQLGLLDAMERRATDSEELAELFRVDHLATRMRRNAENLIVLSGATAGRAWRKPVPMVDVLRGALAEVEDYTRVTVLPVGNVSLLGRAVGDVIHLLAELIENAVSFSPPQTVVRVGGSMVGNGFAIEIEDRGLGIGADELAAANQQLSEPPEFKLTSTARLGLYVVGQLALRHGVKVRLAESAYGGTTAVVLLPAAILADDRTDPMDGDGYDSTERTSAMVLTSGRHREENVAARAELATTPYPGRRPDLDEQPSRAQDPWRTYVTAGPTQDTPANGVPVADGAADLASTVPVPADLAALDFTARPEAGDPPPLAVRSPGATRPAEPANPRRGEPTMLTPSGLPWRQREPGTAPPGSPPPPAAAPAPPILPGPAVGPGAPAVPLPSRTGPDRPGGANGNGHPTEVDGEAAGRPPEEVRAIMSSYRSGTLRGRTEAARLMDSAELELELDTGEITTVISEPVTAEPADPVSPTEAATGPIDSTPATNEGG